MSPVDLRKGGAETASDRWYAWKRIVEKSAENYTEKQIWETAWKWATAWTLQTTAAISPAVDTLARLVEYASDVRERCCPHCGMEL